MNTPTYNIKFSIYFESYNFPLVLILKTFKLTGQNQQQVLKNLTNTHFTLCKIQLWTKRNFHVNELKTFPRVLDELNVSVHITFVHPQEYPFCISFLQIKGASVLSCPPQKLPPLTYRRNVNNNSFGCCSAWFGERYNSLISLVKVDLSWRTGKLSVYGGHPCVVNGGNEISGLVWALGDIFELNMIYSLSGCVHLSIKTGIFTKIQEHSKKGEYDG